MMDTLPRVSQDLYCSARDRFLPSKNFDVYKTPFLKHRSNEFSEELQAEVVLQWLTSKVKVSKIQEFIFVETWNGRTYQQTAEKNSYNYSYIKDAGHKLWRKLSALLDENVTKHNCRAVLSSQYRQNAQGAITQDSSQGLDILNSFLVTQDGQFGSDYLHDADKIAVPSFRGRGKELGTLIEWMALQRLKLIGVFGLAGSGKTTLVLKAVESVRKYFDTVIWRSLRDVPDFNSLLCSILSSFSEDCSFRPEDETSLLISCLLEHCETSRVLLVFDDWSSVFANHTLAGIYRKETEKYGLLLRRLNESSHNSCVVITSREKPSGLVFKQRDTPLFSQTRSLFTEGLTYDNGQNALADFGLTQGEPDVLEQLLHYYSGNPYALRIAVNTICCLFGGDVSYFLAQKNLIYGEIKSLLAAQLSRISTAEQEVMASLSQQSNPVTLETLITRGSSPADVGTRLEALESLLDRGFIWRQNDVFGIPKILENYLVNYPLAMA